MCGCGMGGSHSGRLPCRLKLGELTASGLVASARDWNELPRGRW